MAGHPSSFRPALPTVLFAIYLAFWVALAIAPISREDWLLENAIVAVAMPLLIRGYWRHPFTQLSYVCLFAFFMIHAVGAHYTYSLVPYPDWWRSLAGSGAGEALAASRNHYDRFVHFGYGLLILPPARELLSRVAPATGFWAWLLPLFFILSHSALYELIEGLAAMVFAGDLGQAYLGTQGDPWDTQKDMACAAAGSIVATLLLPLARRVTGPRH